MPSSQAALGVPAPGRDRGAVRPRWSRLGVPQLVLLGAATAVGPLTIDLYLPAFPAMAADLRASDAAIQLSLTAVVVGIAIGQVVLGPLADRWGRRPPLLLGFAGYVAASLVVALSTTLPMLLAGRLLQGFMASAGIVVARAVLRDYVSGPALGRALAGLLLVIGVVPILAPVLGSLLVPLTGWRGIFVSLAVLGLALLATLAARLPESLPASQRRPTSVRALAFGYWGLLTDRSFIAPALVSALGFGALFAWLSDGSFLLQGRYGLSEFEYGLVFGLVAAAVISGSQVGSRVMHRFSAPDLMRALAVLGAVASVVLVVLASTENLPLPTLVGLVVAGNLASGALLPVGATVALTSQPPHRAGQASGLLGVLQFLLAGIAAPLAGLVGSGSALGMAAVMVTAFVVASLVGMWTPSREPASA